MKVLVAQSCPTLCDLPGSSIHGILQASILEWVAIPFSRRSSHLRDQTQVSCITVDSLSSEPPGKHRLGHTYPILLVRKLPFKEVKWLFQDDP